MADDDAQPSEQELLELLNTLGAHKTAASAVDPDPTDGQKEAGNYRKGHISFQGIPISIENAKDGTRRGVGADGEPWEVKMPAHYGYIKRTEGADGDNVDAYVGPNPHAKNVYVVDQRDADKGTFDEHKAMLGFDHPNAARDAYHAGFSDGRGPDRVGGVTHFSVPDFKNWLASGNTKKPLAAKNAHVKSYAEGGTVEGEGDNEWGPPEIAGASGTSDDDDEWGPPEISNGEVSMGRAAYLGARRGVAPTLGGVLAGAAVGAAVGGPAAPITAAVGGIAGALGGGYAISKLQEHLWPMSEEEKAGEQQRPYSTMAGGLAPAIVTFSPGRAAALASRVLSGGIMGGVEAGQELATEGTVDPGKVALATGAGALFNSPTRVGRAAMRYGEKGGAAVAQSLSKVYRPDIKATPESVEIKADADTAKLNPTTSIGVATEQAKPNEDVSTVGNNNGERSERQYPKEPAVPKEESTVTTGDIPADQRAALHEIFGDIGTEPADAGPAPRNESTGIVEAATGRPMPDANRYLNRKVPSKGLDLSVPAERTEPPAITNGGEPVRGASIPTPEEHAIEMARVQREGEAKISAKIKGEQQGDTAAEIPATEVTERPAAPVTATVTKSEEPIQGSDKAVIKQAIKAAKESGMLDLAKRLEKAEPADAQEVLKRLRPQKRATVSGVENAPIASGEVDARNKARAVAAAKSAFDAFPPVEGPIPVTPAAREEFRGRLEKAVAHATEENLGQDPLAYKPREEPAPSMWLRAAKRFLAGRPTPKRVAEFIATEKQLRAGTAEDIANVRGTGRVEGDIARRRTPTVEVAENAQAKEFPGELVTPEEAEQWTKPEPVEPDAEGKLVAKNKGVLKSKQLEDEATAEKTGKLQRAREAAEIMSRANKEPIKESEGAASDVRKIEITPELRAKYEGKVAIDAAVERANKAKNELGEVELQTEGKSPDERTRESVAKQFINDESGSLNVKALGAWLSRNSPPAYPTRSTYTARPPKGAAQVKASVISDKLHQISQEHTSDAIAIKQHAETMPPLMRTAKIQKDAYLAIESKNTAKLPSTVQAFLTKYLKPQMDEIDQLYANISKIDPALLPTDRGYIHRIAVGHTRGLDAIDPVTGMTNGLNRSTSALQDRVFMALESPTGQRAVISPDERGLTLWNKGKKTTIKAPGFDMQEGATVKLGKTTFTVKQALTPEIEANARFKNGEMAKYHQNAIVSVGDTLLKLREVARHLQFLDGLKTDPDFTAHATTDPRIASENGWKESILPEIHGRYQNQLSHVIRKFRGWYMDDQLRYVFNDYAKAGFETDSLDGLRKINQGIVKTIFWNPVPHAANVFWHWWVGRGWDWVTPRGYRDLAVEGTRAIKSVMSQDVLQKELRDTGAGTILGGIITKDWMRNFANVAGMDIKKNPSKWDPIARTLGIGPSDLIKAIYDGSSRTMWAVNDVLLTQQVLANKNKGMSTADAIVHAERHIPNYRVPATIMGSGKGARFLSQVVQDPAFVTFGRYHYGVFNSLAHMAKDLTAGTGQERFEAIGNIMALGLFIYGAKPALDALAKQITGNKDAEVRARGPASPILGVRDVLKGTKDISQIAGATVTITPLIATALNTLRNKDWAGRDITERGDWRKLGQGSVKAGGRLLAQEGEHAARNLISPYGTLANTLDKKQPLLAGLRDQVLDISNPSMKSVIYKTKQPIKDLKASTRREVKPRGPLEGVYNKLTNGR